MFSGVTDSWGCVRTRFWCRGGWVGEPDANAWRLIRGGFVGTCAARERGGLDQPPCVSTRLLRRGVKNRTLTRGG